VLKDSPTRAMSDKEVGSPVWLIGCVGTTGPFRAGKRRSGESGKRAVGPCNVGQGRPNIRGEIRKSEGDGPLGY